MRWLLVTSCLIVSACSSIDLPDLDMLDRAFRDSETDLNDTPDVEKAPVVPSDLRSAESWDEAAKAIAAERDALALPDISASQTDPEAEFERLRAEVRAYKLDDPDPSRVE